MKMTEMELSIITVITNIFTKAGLLLNTTVGWWAALLLTLLAFFEPLYIPVLVLSIIILVDMILGIIIHRKHILSSKLRLTLVKWFFYLLFGSLLFSVESTVGMSILYKIAFGIASMIELWSVMGNMSILMPGMKFFAFFKKILKEEMSKKLEMSVDEILKDDDMTDKLEKSAKKILKDNEKNA
jgi:hypothetical protein